MGVPGQVRRRGRRRLQLGQAGLRTQQLRAQRRREEGMAAGVRPGLQRHIVQGQPADGRQCAQRGPAKLRIPIPAAHVPQDPGAISLALKMHPLLMPYTQDISKVAINGLLGVTYVDKVLDATEHKQSDSSVTITGEVDRVVSSFSKMPPRKHAHYPIFLVRRHPPEHYFGRRGWQAPL